MIMGLVNHGFLITTTLAIGAALNGMVISSLFIIHTGNLGSLSGM